MLDFTIAIEEVILLIISCLSHSPVVALTLGCSRSRKTTSMWPLAHATFKHMLSCTEGST